jgi:hypothetical protein
MATINPLTTASAFGANSVMNTSGAISSNAIKDPHFHHEQYKSLQQQKAINHHRKFDTSVDIKHHEGSVQARNSDNCGLFKPSGVSSDAFKNAEKAQYQGYLEKSSMPFDYENKEGKDPKLKVRADQL